eukprot:CAMPEP_0185300538 /NCGR_PEP_ID=MMETSP1363-20130426/12094_1 /TAXON_ID=38817 /ORGANISM="Gephyrocapsa oceanica, Strain RCC1303" /LENGTH=89 /DNA_ID=CAMNT_0027897509 /DNA_START=7 /DNA_END=273 /DNA_ORIENTATION=+
MTRRGPHECRPESYLSCKNAAVLELPRHVPAASRPWRRCAIEPYSAATPRRGTLHRPSSDAKASTDRAPRPEVWASTALSSGRVVVRGA